MRYVANYEQATAHGHPYFDDFVRKSEALALHDILMYATDHLIFTYDLMRVIGLVAAKFQRFLIIGRRWDLDLRTQINFTPGWEDVIRQRAVHEGKYQSTGAKDYLIFRRPFPVKIPKFIVGYPWYDTWMVVAAQRAGIPVIDASRAVLPIHQVHQFREGTIADRERTPQTQRNAQLAAGMEGKGQTVSAQFLVTVFDVLEREKFYEEEQLQ